MTTHLRSAKSRVVFRVHLAPFVRGAPLGAQTAPPPVPDPTAPAAFVELTPFTVTDSGDVAYRVTKISAH